MVGKINSRAKGQTGERAAVKLLAEWAAPIYHHHSLPMPEFERNLDQTRWGGYDINGLDWLAIEVKRVEAPALPAWWRQTIAQTGPGQLPFLMHRANRKPWRFRVHVLHYSATLVADLDKENAQSWFQWELYTRLTKKVQDDANKVL